MILKDDRKGCASIILRRLKGQPSYNEMKDTNETKMNPALYGEKPEPEYEEKPLTSSSEDGMDRVAESLMEAFQSKNASSIKANLMSMMKMMMDQEKES